MCFRNIMALLKGYCHSKQVIVSLSFSKSFLSNSNPIPLKSNIPEQQWSKHNSDAESMKIRGQQFCLWTVHHIQLGGQTKGTMKKKNSRVHKIDACGLALEVGSDQQENKQDGEIYSWHRSCEWKGNCTLKLDVQFLSSNSLDQTECTLKEWTSQTWLVSRLHVEVLLNQTWSEQEKSDIFLVHNQLNWAASSCLLVEIG